MRDFAFAFPNLLGLGRTIRARVGTFGRLHLDLNPGRVGTVNAGARARTTPTATAPPDGESNHKNDDASDYTDSPDHGSGFICVQLGDIFYLETLFGTH